MSGHRHHDPQGLAWELTAEEHQQLLALPPRERYGLFLQLAVDWEESWGLRNPDGWVLSSGADGGDVFPLWPHPSLAEACAHGDWEGTTASPIPLDELLDDLLSILEEDAIRVAVFPGPDGESTVVSPGELRADLEAEQELGS